jgi:hypothetical protein
MKYLRFVPIICILGSLVGFFSFTQLWVHETTSFEWMQNLTGMDLMNCEWDGFQKYIPTLMVVFSALTVIIAILTMTVRGFWFGTFICMVFGIVILALTSVFSMWVVDGEKMVHFVDTGFWLSYAAGALMVVGAAIQYAAMFRKPARPPVQQRR